MVDGYSTSQARPQKGHDPAKDPVQEALRRHKNRVPPSTKTQQVQCSIRLKCFGGLVAVGNAQLSPTWMICRRPFPMSYQMWLVSIWVPKRTVGSCLAFMDPFRCCRRPQLHQEMDVIIEKQTTQ